MRGSIFAKKIDLWVLQGLPFQAGPEGERLFDPFEVNNFGKRLAVDGKDDFVSTHLAPDHRRMVEHMDDQGIGGECRMKLEFKRTFSLDGIAPGTKLRLRAPAPLGGKYLKQIEIKPWVETGGKAEVNVGPGRLEARVITVDEPFATIGATFDFTVSKQTGDGSGNVDRDLYLKEQEGLIAVTPKIREMAHTLVPRDTPALETINTFWDYLNGAMIFGSVHYDQIDMARPSDWIVEHGWYDCQTGAAVLASLCRASGIPARLVCGYLIYDRAPIRHYWMEAWLEETGWTPFDLFSWNVSEGGRDIAWRDHFFGKVDYRLMLERMPHEFTGAVGIPLPPVWILLPQLEQGGVGSYFHGVDGKLVYSDFLRVTS